MFLTVQPACSVLTASWEFAKHLDHLRVMLAKDYFFLPEGFSFRWSLGGQHCLLLSPSGQLQHRWIKVIGLPAHSVPQDWWLETLMSIVHNPQSFLFLLSSWSKQRTMALESSIQVLEKAMAPHSSTLAWKIPWMEDPVRLQSMGSLDSDMTEWLHFHFSLSCVREGNGNPLQCSCLENPRDGGAWWAAIYRVAQSQTQLKRLSSSSIQVSILALSFI